MTTAGSSMHYSIEVVARRHGIDTKTINMVPLQSLPNMAAAFKGGTVDGAIYPVTTWRQVEADAGMLQQQHAPPARPRRHRAH